MNNQEKKNYTGISTLKKIFGEKEGKINLDREPIISLINKGIKFDVEQVLARQLDYAVPTLKKIFGEKEGKINLDREPFWKKSS